MQKLQVILAYLKEQFSGHGVTLVEDAESATPSFLIEDSGGRYELQVDPDFLNGNSADELRGRLEQWRVKHEICRAEGLPVILTERGIRLVSSN